MSRSASEPGRLRRLADAARAGGAVLVILAGLAAVVAITVIAIYKVKNESNVVALTSSAIGVIGTIVGAYFGIKLGSASTQDAQDTAQHLAETLQRREPGAGERRAGD